MELTAIKAEIEALKIPKTDIEACVDDERRMVGIVRNNTIRDVLAIIDSHIEPKDEPTEPGLWQCTKNGANHIIDVAEDLAYPKYCKGGQWTKVDL